MFKWTKRILAAGIVVLGAGVLVFGTGFGSYLRSSGRMLKTAVKDSIPVEFEIQRARDLLDDLIPEMQANLRLVAAEEVDVANLEREVQKQKEAVEGESGKIQVLRTSLKTQMASYSFGGREYQRSEVVEELARRFEYLKTADIILKGKEDLLKNRRKSLDAAIQKLDKTRIRRIELASQIEALEGQFRLIQAQASGSEFHLDDTKLAQTERVIAEVKNRLEVAQRVLAQEARFIENIPVDPTVNESSLVSRVDTFFTKKDDAATSPTVVTPAVADGAK